MSPDWLVTTLTPHGCLESPCADVEFPELHIDLVDSEYSSFVAENGHYGIAAPQFSYGRADRLFYLNEDRWTDRLSHMTHRGWFVNPSYEVDYRLGFSTKNESCLSVPGRTVRVKRPNAIIASWESLVPMEYVIGHTMLADRIAPNGKVTYKDDDGATRDYYARLCRGKVIPEDSAETMAKHGYINLPKYQQRLSGMLARAFQHECDHTDGRLITHHT